MRLILAISTAGMRYELSPLGLKGSKPLRLPKWPRHTYRHFDGGNYREILFISLYGYEIYLLEIHIAQIIDVVMDLVLYYQNQYM